MRTLNTFARLAADHGLTAIEQCVWFHLWVRAYWPDDAVTLSALKIAEMCRISKRQVVRVIKRLADTRFLVVTTRGGVGRGPSTYRLYPAPYPEPRLGADQASVRNYPLDCGTA
jgi:hypothetical protein